MTKKMASMKRSIIRKKEKRNLNRIKREKMTTGMETKMRAKTNRSKEKNLGLVEGQQDLLSPPNAQFQQKQPKKEDDPFIINP